MLDTFYDQEQKCKYQNWLTGLVVCNCKFLVTLYIYWYMFGYHPCVFFTLLKGKAVALRKAYRGSGVQGDIVLWHPQVWITLPWMLDLSHNAAYQTTLVDGNYKTWDVSWHEVPAAHDFHPQSPSAGHSYSCCLFPGFRWICFLQSS